MRNAGSPYGVSRINVITENRLTTACSLQMDEQMAGLMGRYVRPVNQLSDITPNRNKSITVSLLLQREQTLI